MENVVGLISFFELLKLKSFEGHLPQCPLQNLPYHSSWKMIFFQEASVPNISHTDTSIKCIFMFPSTQQQA